MAQNIRQMLSDAYLHGWKETDWRLYHATKRCSVADISNWPVDATRVFEDDSHILLFGSVKSACDIEEVNASLGVTVNVVITMNGEDEKRKGERDNYGIYYKRLGVMNFRYSGWDEKTWAGPAYDAKKETCRSS